ncbi:MAG: UDP-N-acetylmuramoyl-L-alanine--D-glutamate ligase [Myxococcales bacterium]|nr:UDP-N-acetylmuramoyl-L-alanine--D-glutamate ligase [Myxococcales bacterium]MCB9577974.1 UDP-N-acetylmuramoyl-L-alanine--D-glutamate ligase [Polyangiaceae bacterium]
MLVVGLGKSGVAAARLCLARGARVSGTDRASAEQLSPEARGLGIPITPHESTDFRGQDLIVVSPGVPAMPELDATGAEVIGELELAARFVTRPIVCIGGTNGKSTVTSLVRDIFVAAGLRVFAGANLGTPSAEAADGDWDVVVFEASSFQLERVSEFHPRVSVLLNVSEDHLDRYASFQAYADAKGNAFTRQTLNDFAVVPEADAACRQQAERGEARVLTFGAAGDYAVNERSVAERATGEVFSLGALRLHGRHNLDNAAAAIAASRALGVSPDSVAKGLAAFEPLPHRMALVADVKGVRFYDDSKATNVGAAVTALRGLSETRGVLIAGGRDKLGSYEPLVSALAEKGRAVVVIGEAAERIAAAVGDTLPVHRAATMKDAVRQASELAQEGDAVLLSPACSSYDMFKSYSDRGDAFVRAVHEVSA